MRGFRTILAGFAALIGGALASAGEEAPDGTSGPLRSSTDLEGFTFRYPQTFDAAVRLAAPEMREKREAVRAALAEAAETSETSKGPSGVPGVPETVGADFAASGLGDQGRIAEWFDSLPGVARSMAPEMVRALLEVKTIEIWPTDDLKAHFEAGGTVPCLARTDDGVSFSFEKDPKTGAYPQSLPFVIPSDQTAALTDDQIGNSLAEFYSVYHTLVQQGMEQLAEAYTGDRGTFVALRQGAEFGLMTEVIRSPDRRWFGEGLVNVIAIRLCDRYLGEGRGEAAFASLYPPKELEAEAKHVDLARWPTAEDEGEAQTPHTPAHSYFATRAIQKALEGQPEEFIARWIAEIKSTPIEIVTMDTVEAAYAKLTDGKSLQAIGDRITTP